MDHPIALALSGGGDSLALLRIAADWSRTAGRRLLAITVDHGLNPHSPDWSRRCEAMARASGADWVEARWEGEKPTTGLPAAARRARHALIARAAREAGARVVLFAHTADDIAEADWMRARGSTLGHLREWSPSPVWPEGRGLMLLRPMLEEGRGPLRDWLRLRGEDWIEDPGNAGFGRGAARRALNPLSAGEGLRLAESSDGQGQSPAAPGRSNPLPLGEGFQGERSMGAAELAAVLLCASGGDTPPRRNRLEAVLSRLASGADFTATLAGARIAASGDRVLIGRESGELRRRPPASIPLQANAPAVWDGRYEITARGPGWAVTAALGRLNALSKADRAVVNTVPAWARGGLPVLMRDDSTAPVLAWRAAEVRALGPGRLWLAHAGRAGETTQECDLFRSIRGETPPPDLF